MIATAVGLVFCPNRKYLSARRAWHATWAVVPLALLTTVPQTMLAQAPDSAPAPPASASSPTAIPAPGPQSGPIAIVPIDASSADQAATVTGALRVTQGKALIATSGTI